MSRVIYPTDFEEQVSLFKNILTRYVNDGVASALKPFLAHQGIDITADVTAMSKAVVHEQSRLLLLKQSENNRELCNMRLEKVLAHIKSCMQFLKSYYKPDYDALCDWGVHVYANGRISYPASVEERINLFNAMKAKHDSFGFAESPLLAFIGQNAIDFVADGDDTVKALVFHQQSQLSSKTAEYEAEQRDLVWGPVNNNVCAIGDYLKKIYGGNPKTMGLWGFVMDNSLRLPRSVRDRATIIE